MFLDAVCQIDYLLCDCANKRILLDPDPFTVDPVKYLVSGLILEGHFDVMRNPMALGSN